MNEQMQEKVIAAAKEIEVHRRDRERLTDHISNIKRLCEEHKPEIIVDFVGISGQVRIRAGIDDQVIKWAINAIIVECDKQIQQIDLALSSMEIK